MLKRIAAGQLVGLAAGVAGRLLDLLLPPSCLSCQRPVAGPIGLCPRCWPQLHFLSAPACAACGHPFSQPVPVGSLCGACLQAPPPWDRARAVFRYDQASKGLVLSFKHADRPGLARHVAPWLARAAAELLRDADLLVPVPLHRWRLLRRRYNQAALLAIGLSRITGIPCIPDLLRRQRRTPPQGQLNRRQRHSNVTAAFALAVPPAEIKGRRLLLVDDVLTTGATVGECARLLRQQGAAAVDVVTLARVVL